MANGTHNLDVLIIDTTGKQSEWSQSSFKVDNPLPVITLISPKAGQQVSAKTTVEISMSSPLGNVTVGINATSASPTGYANSSSINVSGVPAETQFWSAGSAKTFSWLVDTSSWPVGQHTIIVSVVDRANQLVTAQVTIDVLSVKPSLMISTPAANQQVKGKFNVSAYAMSSSAAGRTISYVGISELYATPTFANTSGYSYKMPSKYKEVAVPSGLTSMPLNWTIDYSKATPGIYSLSIAVEDSAGDVTEQTVTFTVAKAIPVVTIISPTRDQTLNGAINLKVSAMSDPATTAKIAYIAVSSTLFTPQFLGRSTYSCQLDSRYSCLAVEDLKDYNWTSPAGSWKDGNYTITVIAIDDNGNTATQTVQFTVSVVAPTVSIASAGSTIISKSPFTLNVTALPNMGSGAEIVTLAINDKNATPQFAGTTSYKNIVGLPADAAIWQVANIKNPAWRINPTYWSEGDHVVNVFAIDSNGKIGQTSITFHVAPEAKWIIDLQGVPVLGQSVPVLVTMTTNAQRRMSPPVVVTLQTSSTSAGPWTDLGQITLDSSGTGSGRVLVTESLYVRVNHPDLDAVQPGTGEVKRIVNAPDPNRNSGSTGKGELNPDGSQPLVTCTVQNTAKAGAKISFVCSAKDVQDTSQPVTIYQSSTSSKKKAIGSARISGTKVTGSFTVKSKGKYTFILQGASSGDYVAWSSNSFSVTYK
jgi:hypothetical protein